MKEAKGTISNHKNLGVSVTIVGQLEEFHTHEKYAVNGDFWKDFLGSIYLYINLASH